MIIKGISASIPSRVVTNDDLRLLDKFRCAIQGRELHQKTFLSYLIAFIPRVSPVARAWGWLTASAPWRPWMAIFIVILS